MGTSRVAGIELERRGNGEPLLLVHGTGCDHRVWKAVVEPLSAERELLLVDLPGHGASPPPPEGVPHNPIGYAEVLAGMLDELGIDAVHAAGNSVGGWTSLELAKRGRARSVVGLSPAGLWAKRDPWRCVAQLSSQHTMGRALLPVMRPLLRSSVGRTVLMSGTVARPRQLPAADAIELTETFAHTPCFREHLAETRRARFEGGTGIEAPVTIAWGAKDRLIPKKARLTGELPSHARVLDLPGCGHVPIWDDPELVTGTILDGARPPAA